MQDIDELARQLKDANWGKEEKEPLAIRTTVQEDIEAFKEMLLRALNILTGSVVGLEEVITEMNRRLEGGSK